MQPRLRSARSASWPCVMEVLTCRIHISQLTAYNHVGYGIADSRKQIADPDPWLVSTFYRLEMERNWAIKLGASTREMATD